MKSVCTGPMQFTPYRPWSQERRDAARARELARLGLGERKSSAARTLPRVYSKLDWSTPVLTDITQQTIAAAIRVTRQVGPAVEKIEANAIVTTRLIPIPARREWTTPDIYELGCISVAEPNAASTILWLCEDEDDFIVEDDTILCAIHLDMNCFEFKRPMLFTAGYYAIEIGDVSIEVYSLEGDPLERTAFGVLAGTRVAP